MSFAQDRLRVNHLFIPYLALLIVVLGGVVVNGGVSWYYSLALPSWHPSALLIVLIGTFIYVCGAWSLLIVWNGIRESGFQWIVRGFGLLVLLNLLWSLSFFQFHLLLASLLIGIIFGFGVLVLMARIWSISRKASLLLVPFALWIAFALVVQYFVLALNT
tara:strand:- start:313782 stop:314264 length:483 start_codon:yes stop_codon:yes gene_type:complete